MRKLSENQELYKRLSALFSLINRGKNIDKSTHYGIFMVAKEVW